MTDREKVIKGLKCCTKKVCIYKDTEKECPYSEFCGEYEDSFEDCTTALSKDALALLKAQEPRVMTIEEYDEWANIPFTERNPVFFEQRSRRGTITWWTNTTECCREEYGKRERCWTSRPDQATREATPWES